MGSILLCRKYIVSLLDSPEFYWRNSPDSYYSAQVILFNYILMGNTNKQPADFQIVRSYRKEDWDHREKVDNRQFWTNRTAQLTAEVFRLYQVPTVDDLNRYEWRNTQNDLVRVHHIAMNASQGFCSKNEYAQLLVEHIPIKLSQVEDLTEEEALTVLAAILRAFSLIEANFESVEPHEDLIGFNESGRPKIWINKDRSRNFPEKAYVVPCKNSRYEVCSNVGKIVDMVQQRTCNGLLPPFLKDQIRQKHPDYNQALFILEQFAYYERLNLKAYLRANTVKNGHRKVRQQTQRQALMSNDHLTQNQSSRWREGRRELAKQYSTGDFHSRTEAQTMVQLPQNRDSQQRYREGLRSVKVSFVSNSPQSQSVPKIAFVTNGNGAVQGLNDLPADKKSFVATQNVPQLQSDLAAGEQRRRPIIKKVFNSTQPHFILVRSEQQRTGHMRVNRNSNFSQAYSPNEAADSNRQAMDHWASKQVKQNEKEEQSNSKTVKSAGVSIIDNLMAETGRQQSENQANLVILANTEEGQFKESATFKPLTDNQLNAIARQASANNTNQSNHLVKTDGPEQLPVNLISFAPNPVDGNQFVSFAPVETNIATQQSIQQPENPVETIQSIEIHQEVKGDQDITLPLKHTQQQAVKSSQDELDKKEIMSGQPDERHRVSIDEQLQQNDRPQPFYANYTAVESKFDVIMKRDSMLSGDSKERVSAFALLEDEHIERYIREKYASFINSDREEYPGVQLSSVYSEQYENREGNEHGNEMGKEKQERERASNSKSKINISDIAENTEEDFLDVNFLEQSLRRLYKGENRGVQQSAGQDDMNVASLQQGLLKFSKKKGKGKGKVAEEKQPLNPQKGLVDGRKLQENRVSELLKKKESDHNRIFSTGVPNQQLRLSSGDGSPLKKNMGMGQSAQKQCTIDLPSSIRMRSEQSETVVSIRLEINNQIKGEDRTKYFSPNSKFNPRSPGQNDDFDKIERKYNEYVRSVRKQTGDINIKKDSKSPPLAKVNKRAETKVSAFAPVTNGRYSQSVNRGMGSKKISYDDLLSLLRK